MLRFLFATRYRRWSLLIAFSITTSVILANLTWGQGLTPWKALFDLLEMKTIDWRYQLRARRAAPPDVAIAAIDDESLQRIGRWPWPRAKLAELAEKLRAAGARAIVFDIFLAEPQGEAPDDAASDARLAAAMREVGCLYHGWIGRAEADQAAGSDSLAAFEATAWPVRMPPGGLEGLIAYEGVTPPLAAFTRSAQGIGFGNVVDCGDGVFRWYVLAARVGQAVYPSLALAVAAGDLGVAPEDILVDPAGFLRLGDQGVVPLIGSGTMFLDFYGPSRTVPHQPVCDILDGRLARELAGKIVIVGQTAQGSQTDVRASPFGADFYGVELQATAIANLLERRALRVSAPLVDLLITGGFGLVLGLVLALMRPAYGAAISLLAFLAYNSACTLTFTRAAYLLPMAAPNIAILASLFGVLLYRLATEERQRNRITETFGLFVPPQVVEELTGEEARIEAFQAERREITVLFADIRDFTAYAERRQPEDVVALLNRYFSLMHEVVWQHGGTLDKYMGDGLLAFFGAPTHQEDHADRAVLAAIEMQRQIAERKDEWAQYGMHSLRVGMGLDTGEVLVGFAGSAGRMQYTCMGNVVNLASRLEEENRLLDTDILISGRLHDRVAERIRARPTGVLAIRGFSAPVEAYELLGRAGDGA
ncbi:MAG: adenylate/guanylate cyclase domain-containing protein [Armatimonadetes bacterium]|nr:adenylate/guanylate cyclase domain-containing protein [Armatimonadota bacterium]